MATITITVPNPSAKRVADAVGFFVNNDGVSATPAEVKKYIIDNLRMMVRNHDKALANAAAAAALTDMDDLT